MSEIIRDKEEVVRIILEEGEGAVQCRVPGGEWRCARDGFFNTHEWRRKPVVGTITEEQRLRDIIRRARAGYGVDRAYGDSTAAEMFEILGEAEVEV